MIPVNDQRVSVERRRTALTVVTARRHLTEIPAPDMFAFKGITMHPARAVVDIKMLSIGNG